MILKAALKYLRLRMNEGSTWAGLGVIALFLNSLTGLDFDPLVGAVRDALPAILGGNYIAALIVLLPAVVAILKQDKDDTQTFVSGETNTAPRNPAKAARPMPPGTTPGAKPNPADWRQP